MIGASDELLVMFDNNDRVALVFEFREHVHKTRVVSGVQADRGFVKHIADALERAADLSGQTNALRFSARQ